VAYFVLSVVKIYQQVKPKVAFTAKEPGKVIKSTKTIFYIDD
jgi:hypothetical protein